MPPVPAPEPIEMEPEVPELDVPELKTSTPLTPVSPAFDVRIVIAPLEAALLEPLARAIAPPVATPLSPAVSVTMPPAPLLPLPTVMLIVPPLPPVAVPLPIEMEPDEPEFAVPELNTSTPLTPASPALEVRIVIAPLVLAMPCPLSMPMEPPV